MIFSETPLPGLYVVDVERIEDERGFFARTYCRDQFSAHGLTPPLCQQSVSSNARRGTLRGLHFQAAPHEEDKLVRCTAGGIFDVAVDIRSSSATYRHWYGTQLTARNHRALFIPKGFAHGFLTLSDNTEVLYMVSVLHAPMHSRGLRWNDPAFAIEWPALPQVISERDASFAAFDAAGT